MARGKKVYGYLKRDIRLNNPSYLVWKNKPVGENVFPQYMKVALCKPTRHEEGQLRRMANQYDEPCFVVNVEGHRVYLMRSVLLTEDEYDEIRRDQNKKHSKAKQKLALLKKRDGGVGKGAR